MEEQKLTWDQAYKESKPLISYSILLGIDMLQVKNLVIDILESEEEILKAPLEVKVLSRMPVVDRHDYEFPPNTQDFIYYERASLETEK